MQIAKNLSNFGDASQSKIKTLKFNIQNIDLKDNSKMNKLEEKKGQGRRANDLSHSPYKGKIGNKQITRNNENLSSMKKLKNLQKEVSRSSILSQDSQFRHLFSKTKCLPKNSDK